MRYMLAFGFLLVLSACGGKKEVVATEEVEVQKPSWLTDRPISSIYYIGIGRALKNGSFDEYHAIARKNALNELASEIEINVSSNSLLNSLEQNGSFSERFNQDILTTTDLQLEGFEVWDTWEDEGEYWAYYRLDKSTYARIKAERKATAIQDAEAILALAESSRAEGDVPQAARLYVQSIDALKGYWGEHNPPSAGGDDQSVDKLAYERLLSLKNGFELSSNIPAIQLGLSNDFEQMVFIEALLDGAAVKPLDWEIKKGDESKSTKTGSTITERFEPSMDLETTFAVEVDPFAGVRQTYRSAEYRFIRDALHPYVLQMDVLTTFPALSIDTDRVKTGRDRDVVKAGLIESLVRYGLGTNPNSPYQLSAELSYRDGGMSQGFVVQFVDLQVEAVNVTTGKVVHVERLDNVKGVHSSVEKARIKAVEKALSSISPERLKALLDGLF